MDNEWSEKEGDPTQSYDKSPYTHRKTPNATLQHTNATKKFDYTTIADQLRTSNWGNDTHVQLVWLNRCVGTQPSHLPQKLWNSKDTHLKFVNNPPCKGRGPTAN